MPRTDVAGTTTPPGSGAQRCAQAGEREHRTDSTAGPAKTIAASGFVHCEVRRREHLPNRRLSETFAFACNGLSYLASISRFQDGRLAEIFISSTKAGSHSDSACKDAAVVCSIALQHGVPVEVIRHALLRDSQGRAASPLGAALDLVAERQP